MHYPASSFFSPVSSNLKEGLALCLWSSPRSEEPECTRNTWWEPGAQGHILHCLSFLGQFIVVVVWYGDGVSSHRIDLSRTHYVARLVPIWSHLPASVSQLWGLQAQAAQLLAQFPGASHKTPGRQELTGSPPSGWIHLSSTSPPHCCLSTLRTSLLREAFTQQATNNHRLAREHCFPDQPCNAEQRLLNSEGSFHGQRKYPSQINLWNSTLNLCLCFKGSPN